MGIKAIIIGNDVMNVQLMKSYLRDENIELVGSFDTLIKAFQLISNNSIDVVFLDIDWPNINGLDFIRNLYAKPKIVITTNSREYAIESYTLNVLDYLVKPISQNRFHKTINKINQQVHVGNSSTNKSSLQEPYFFLKVKKKLVKIKLNDILIVESIKEYIKIITRHSEYIVRKPLGLFIKELPSIRFIRVHRSFIISINKIVAIEGNTIEIASKKIPIGRKYVNHVKQTILNID